MTEKVILLEGVDPVELYGAGNSNIEKISAKFPKLKIIARGSSVKVMGEASEIGRFEQKLTDLIDYYGRYGHLSGEVIDQVYDGGMPKRDETADKDAIVFGNNGVIVRAPSGVRMGERRITCRRCGLTQAEAIPPEIAAYEQFQDIDRNAWSYDGIAYCVARGLMSGTDTHTFSPGGVTTRAQLVQVLYNLAGEPDMTDVTTPFADARSGWYRDAVAWAYQTGVVAGTSDTTFSPDLPVTREQIAVILMEYAAKVLELTNGGEKADLAAFPDGGQVSDWARDAMADAVALGLISGAQTKDGTLLLPQNSATREQVATILMEFYTSIDNALIDVTTA